MVTNYKRFCSNNNTIDNCVPLQTDNRKPLEIVIHLYKEVDGFEANNSLDNSIHIMKCINEEQNEEKSRNLTVFLKNEIENRKETILTTNRRASLTTSPSPKSAKVFDNLHETSDRKKLECNLLKLVNYNSEISVQMGQIISVNQFYLHLSKWDKLFRKMSQDMEKDYAGCETPSQCMIDDSSLPNITLNLTPKVISENLIKTGLVCAYANITNKVYRRVMVAENLRRKTTEVKVYLIDLGTYMNVNIGNLFNLKDKYFEYEPLCFECTLGLGKMARPELDEQVLIQFKKLVKLNINFKIKIVNQLKELTSKTNVSEGIDCFTANRYHVNLFGTRAEPRDPNTELTINFGDELRSFGSSLSTKKIMAPQSPPSSCLLWDKLAEKTFAFNETEMPLGETLKIKLINLHSVKNFSVILRCHIERRQEFLAKFYKWHKENRKNLVTLLDNSVTSKNMKSFIGMPCVLTSVQIGKWCRGLIIELNIHSQMATIYMVDHG